jgi:hypothetical protein
MPTKKNNSDTRMFNAVKKHKGRTRKGDPGETFEQFDAQSESHMKTLYRDREWNKAERNQQKQSRKLNWFKGSAEKIEYKLVRRNGSVS